MLKKRICPSCQRSYRKPPALSRKDNLTEICPDCGLREALDAAIAFNRFKAAYYNGRVTAEHTVTLNRHA